MNIGIQTWGSDGDILPFMALAEGLQSAGHHTTVAYTSVDNKDYSAYSRRGGFQSFKACGAFATGMGDAMGDIVGTNDPMKQFVLVMKDFFDPAVEAMYEASTRLCSDNDIVIGHMMNHTLLSAAEKFHRPRAVVALAPLAIRTRQIPLFGPNLGPWLNPLTWMLGDYVGRKKLFARAEAIRKREGMRALKSTQEQLYTSRELTLIASSPTLTPRRKDWGAHIQICGDLRFSRDDLHIPMPPGLAEFISAGEPPVYMTFGSLSPFESEALDHLMSEAAEKAQCRAIIQSPSRNETGGNIFKCDRSPHAHVFPDCRAVVHHGGAGTTHSALRADCPSVVVEHAFDQLFWGQSLQKAGVAGPVLHRNTLTAGQLADAIRRTMDSAGMRRSATKLGQQMRTENGVAKAVDLIEQRFAR